MATKAFRASLERLETRETPSSGGVHAAAISGTAIHGSGQGAVTQFNNRVNSFEISSNLQGKSSTFGNFTGAQNASLFFKGRSHGAVVLVDAAGDRLTLTLEGTSKITRAVDPATSSFKFTVASGTGKFANATGSGHAASTFNVIRGGVHFTFQGRIKTA